MTDLSTKIQTASSVDELAELLNSYDETKNDGRKLDEEVDICELPTFGEYDMTKYDCGIFSWDDTSVLIYNDCLGDDGEIGWETVPRCSKCGLADFSCECEY